MPDVIPTTRHLQYAKGYIDLGMVKEASDLAEIEPFYLVVRLLVQVWTRQNRICVEERTRVGKERRIPISQECLPDPLSSINK
jgi:hypothetical protein